MFPTAFLTAPAELPDQIDPLVYVAEDAELAVIAERLLQDVQLLHPSERTVLTLRYGLDGEDMHSLRETAERLGSSFSGVRKIEHRALDRLRTLWAPHLLP